MIISPSALWLIHRAALGGVSSISGAPLPETLADCPAGPQESHYAMACAIATAHGSVDIVPIPPKVTPERAKILRETAQRQARSIAGLAGVFQPLVASE